MLVTVSVAAFLAVAGPTASKNLQISFSLPDLVISDSGGSDRMFNPGPQTALQLRELRTRTPESAAEMTFTGIRLADLFDPGEAGHANVLAVSANGHTTGFALGDAVSKGAFVAYAKNGRPLVDYGQGPYWIIFPWSENPSLDVPSVHAMSVWRLVELRME